MNLQSIQTLKSVSCVLLDRIHQLCICAAGTCLAHLQVSRFIPPSGNVLPWDPKLHLARDPIWQAPGRSPLVGTSELLTPILTHRSCHQNAKPHSLHLIFVPQAHGRGRKSSIQELTLFYVEWNLVRTQAHSRPIKTMWGISSTAPNIFTIFVSSPGMNTPSTSTFK